MQLRSRADVAGACPACPAGTRVDERHPRATGPGWLDPNGEPAVLVRCPDCGQMEWWTEGELGDHGLCRASGVVGHLTPGLDAEGVEVRDL